MDATRPRSIRTEVTPPTVEEVVQLLDAAYEDDPAFGTFLWVKSATGCRRGEMCALDSPEELTSIDVSAALTAR